MKKKYTSISKIKAMTIDRMSTGQNELDWLYGCSDRPDDGKIWGMPVGTISTWVGEGGVGKSRLAINIAKTKVLSGKTVLYFQNEVDLPTLAYWVNDNKLDDFYCSEVTSLADQSEAVMELKPDLVVVDSINLVDEFGTGTAKSIKKIIDSFRAAIKGTKCHVIILCQLNKEGSATGSTALGHLPDVNINLTNTEEDEVFQLTIGKKHRYGRKGKAYHGLWRHTDDGVESISHNRMKDNRWNLALNTENLAPNPVSPYTNKDFFTFDIFSPDDVIIPMAVTSKFNFKPDLVFDAVFADLAKGPTVKTKRPMGTNRYRPLCNLSPGEQYDIAHKKNIAEGRVKKKGWFEEYFLTPYVPPTREELEIIEYDRAIKQMEKAERRAEADELGGKIIGGLLLGAFLGTRKHDGYY